MTEAIPIDEFLKENWDFFTNLEIEAEKALTEISRELPPEAYDEMRNKLLEFLLLSGLDGKVSINSVIDSDIIVGDTMRIVSGKKSTTKRILSSRYARYIAPPEIIEEVERNIKKNLENDPRLDLALAHSKDLLSNIDIVPIHSDLALEHAKSILSNHLKDAPFLATYLEFDADAIISRETKTFDKLGICHWKLGMAVEVVVTYESGSLALVIAGTVIKAILDAFVKIILIFLKALQEVIEVIMNILSAIAEGTIDFVERLPGWAKIVIISIGVGVIIGIIFHEGFRNWICGGIEKIGESLSTFINKIMQILRKIWYAFKDLLILLWNTALPLTTSAVILGGALLRRICRLIGLTTSLSKNISQNKSL